MGYSFFRGSVHMWQRAISNEQDWVVQKSIKFKASKFDMWVDNDVPN
jgi:hypothetical protein